MLTRAEIAQQLRPRRLAAACVGLAFAAAIGTTLVTAGPADPAFHLEQARDLTFQKNPEAALRSVRKALAELGDDGDPALRLKALARGAQIVDFHLGEQRAPEALAFYRRIVREFPSSPEAFDAGVRVAELLRQRFHDDARAEEQFVSVVDAFPTQPGVERLLLRAARVALENRKYERARTSALRILKEYPESELAHDAQYLLGTAFHLEGKHVEATKAFEEVAARWPGTAEAARALADAGNCLAEQGDLGLALARYIEALPEHPDPLAVQKSLERVRRRFTAEREMKPGSKAVAFGPGSFASGH